MAEQISLRTVSLLNRFGSLNLMEFGRASLRKPLTERLLDKFTGLAAGCTLKAFGLKRDFSVGRNENFKDFRHAASP
jgi:hypothetical protein